MKKEIGVLKFALILSGLIASVANAEERCKVYGVAHEGSSTESSADVDSEAVKMGRDRCWGYEREIGKTMSYNPGAGHCETKKYGPNQVELTTCTYDHMECCYNALVDVPKPQDAPKPQAEEHYECQGYAMCHCIPSNQPGSGMTCDYYGSGKGSDLSSAVAAAKASVLDSCEQSCTRKTGNDCYNVSANSCELVRN